MNESKPTDHFESSSPATEASTIPSRYFVSPNSIGRWHTGNVYHSYPTKAKLLEEGLDSISKGWLPVSPLIDLDTRILAVGSCFAKNFTKWLADHGFNKIFPISPYNALINFNADFESPAVVAQQFRWAFDELDNSSLLWINKNKNLIEATDEGKKSVRETLEQTDVLIITLGLSEVWYDKLSGEPLWRALTNQTFDPDRHVFRVESTAKTVEWLECIERLRSKYLTNQKIIFTLSPVPLKTTFRNISAVTANAVSKAILRAAMDEFFRNHQDLIGKNIFYFPSYEMATTYFFNSFEDDNRHLNKKAIDKIISYFSRNYCVSEMQRESENSLDQMFNLDVCIKEKETNLELVSRISELENKVNALQDICDERFLVIQELDLAAKERLDLINRLDAQLKK